MPFFLLANELTPVMANTLTSPLCWMNELTPIKGGEFVVLLINLPEISQP
jgi:hypothetical protein